MSSTLNHRRTWSTVALATLCLAAISGCATTRNGAEAPDDQRQPIVRTYTDLPGFNTELDVRQNWVLDLDLPAGVTADDISAVRIGVNTAGLSFNSELCNINDVTEHCMDRLTWVDGGTRWEIFDRDSVTFTVRTTSAWDGGAIRERQAYPGDRQKEAVVDGFITLGVVPSRRDTYTVSEMLVEIHLK